jgi:hypothetical protein
VLTVKRAQEIAGVVGQTLTRGAGIRAHIMLPGDAHAGDGVDGLKCLRGALLVHAAELADAIGAVDAELCKHTALEPEPLQVVGARVLAREERRRRRLAARP